jgi:outer membrane lipoprotein carrier protein LolA
VRGHLRSWSLKCWSLVLLTAACGIGAASADEAQQFAPGQVLRGQFIQERVLTGFSAPLKTTGSFVLAPGEGLIWQALKPFAVTTVMTAEGISQKNGDVEMLNLPSTKAPFLARLYDILGGALAGDEQPLKRFFDVKRNEDAAGWHLVLTPRQKGGSEAQAFKEIRIDGTRFVDHVTITKGSGDSDQLTFTDQVLDGGPLSAEEAKLLASVGQQ